MCYILIFYGLMMNSATNQFSNIPLLLKVSVVFLSLSLLFERLMPVISLIGQTNNATFISTVTFIFQQPKLLTGFLVPVCLLIALWTTATTLLAFEKAKGFQIKVLNGVMKIGASFIYAAIAAMLIVPSIDAWSAGSGRSFQLHWDVEMVTIGMIGVALKMLARRAESVQRQLDEIV
jgi:hypothetical protein